MLSRLHMSRNILPRILLVLGKGQSMETKSQPPKTKDVVMEHDSDFKADED